MNEILSAHGLEVISQREAGIDLDVEENGTTFEENSFIKAKAITDLTGELAIADDSGLEVDALSGAPGVHSARFAGGHGNDAANRQKVLQLLQNVPDAKRTARCVCGITLVRPDGTKLAARGTVEGRITEEELGDGGFGYDCIFMPDGFDVTFAQMDADQKNRMSHRARALAILREEWRKEGL